MSEHETNPEAAKLIDEMEVRAAGVSPLVRQKLDEKFYPEMAGSVDPKRYVDSFYNDIDILCQRPTGTGMEEYYPGFSKKDFKDLFFVLFNEKL